MRTIPHASWAPVYDVAYERTFGAAYRTLTDNTLQAVRQMATPPARIVDFGAGTGRLAVPLAEDGYRVTAVEPCAEMLDQLRRKKGPGSVITVEATMQDFAGASDFDVALCVFTVLLYLLDEDALQGSLQAAAECLKPGGKLLLDVPGRIVFGSVEAPRQNGFSRSVSVQMVEGHEDIYDYTDDLCVTSANGHVDHYVDQFRIRYWPLERVTEAWGKSGLVLEEDISDAFAWTGSQYFWLRKE